MPELDRDWRVHENCFLVSHRTSLFWSQQKQEGIKVIFVIWEFYLLARRKWGNTETDEWEMKAMFCPQTLKYIFHGYEKGLCCSVLHCSFRYRTYIEHKDFPGHRTTKPFGLEETFKPIKSNVIPALPGHHQTLCTRLTHLLNPCRDRD